MPTKKRTSTKPKSAAPQQADKPTIPPIGEAVLGFTSRFLKDDKCLRGENEHQDLIKLAFHYVVSWPNEFWLLSRMNPPVRMSPAESHCFREMLAQAHDHAVHVLIREAESRGLGSSAIWKASRVAREAILSRKTFHLGPNGWHRPWPDCLGPELHSLPDWQQQAIAEADAVLTRLTAEPPTVQPEQAKAADTNDKLTDAQQQVFELIRDKGPIMGIEIVNKTGVSQSGLTSHIIPALKKKRGVENQPGAGYYLPGNQG